MSTQAGKGTGRKLGINGFGRIGKLAVWHHVGRKYFEEIVVNIGREAGTSLSDIAHYAERDSTYGALCGYLHGFQSGPAIGEIDEKSGTMVIDGTRVRFLRSARNPLDIGWEQQGVKVTLNYTAELINPRRIEGMMKATLKAGGRSCRLNRGFTLTYTGK